MARRRDNQFAFDMMMRYNVLYVRTVQSVRTKQTPNDVLMAVLMREESPDETDADLQMSSLLHFHQRLGHLSYDSIERMAKDPASGIKLTDTKRPTCISCDQGKQTKNFQLRKDTGANSSIDRIGGVICSNLKSSMTPKDRLGNNYLVNFIDHKTN